MMAVVQSAPAARPLAVVIGSGGGLGAALLAQLQAEAAAGGPDAIADVVGLSRHSAMPIDYANEATLAAAAQQLAARCASDHLEVRLLIVATGFLHGPQGQPERSLANLDATYLQHVFAINTLGPALVMKHFLPLLPKSGRSVAGFLSARVGSIGDNALGGWYGYRASKAALNQLVKTASIELARRSREAVCVALHPGTVATDLSQPFAKTGLKVRPPQETAADLLRVLKAAQPVDTGKLMDYQGHTLPY